MDQQFAELEKKPNVLAFQVAIAFAFYSIILVIALRAMGISTDAPTTSMGVKILAGALSYIPFILAIIFVQRKHKAELGGYITFGRAFSAGFKTAFYAGLFTGLLMLLYYKVFDPAALDEIISNAAAAAVANGGGENAAAGVEMMSSYMVYFIAFGAAIYYTIFGLIVSLIGAAVVKNERPMFIDEETASTE